MKASTIIFIAAATLAGLSSCSKGKSDQSATSAPKIDVARAIEDSVVIYHTYPGTLYANNSVQLVARVDGTFASKHYEDGQFVRKGDLLITFEDSQYRDQVQQASAALATAKSNREYAASQYAAMKKALESDAVSQMEVNKAKSSLENAEASIRTAQAQLQTAQTNLSYCRIYAPYSGHVSAPTMSVGSYVNGAGSPVTMATLYEDDTMFAIFHIDDKAMQDILLGNTVSKINLDSIPFVFNQNIPNKYYGHLTYVSPEVDPSTGTLELRAAIPNNHGDLHDGMYCNISLPVKSDPRAILVKEASISTDQLGKYLYTVSDSGKVVYTPIKIGDLANDSMRIVVSGVSAGTPYVTRALLKVREGMQIQPVYQK